MKPSRLSFPLALLILLLAISAAFAVDTQVTIKCRILGVSSGSPTSISAPRVVVLAGQQATIAVRQEHVLALADSELSDHTQTLTDGLLLEVCPVVVGGRVLLKGTVTFTPSVAPASFHKTELEASATLHRQETAFVLSMIPGESKTLPMGEHTTVILRATLASIANAATIYWQAFASLPPAPEGGDSDALTAWLAKSDTALSQLHTAAALPHCDWELDYDLGLNLTLPHLSKMHSLIKAAVARAEANMADHPERAHADLQAAMRAAGHLGVDPLLIVQLVRIAIERQAGEVLAQHLAGMPAASLKSWQGLLAAQPNPPSLTRVLEAESHASLGHLRSQLAEADADAAETVRKATGLDIAAGPDLERMLDVAEADYRELVRLAKLPSSERMPALTTFEQQLQTTSKDHALSKQLIPAIVKAAGKLSRAVADSAALQKKLDALHRQRTAMIEKLDAIIIPRLSLKDAELADVIKFLSRRAKELDPAQKGVNIIWQQANTIPATVNIELENIPLSEAIRYIAQIAGVSFALETHAVVLR